MNASWNLETSYKQLPPVFYTEMSPNHVENPKLIIWNEELAKELGISFDEKFIPFLAGNEWPEGTEPIAQAYAGHQFGHFTMLGDGRAILLGEQFTSKGKKVDIQLKGAGRTPYSRGGDGRAAVGPMLREYLISEAMHALGIPTTRSLAVVATGEKVIREEDLDGAILTRIASSHIRVGTFQFAAKYVGVEGVRELADYTIERHFPEISHTENRYIQLVERMMVKQASLIAKWMEVGFIHGVMNTDNMTLSGETIDYGPCAFMDRYHPETVFSSIDRNGRYAYGNQPPIGAWNIARLAETLLPLIHEDTEEAIRIAEETVDKYPRIYHSYWLDGMRLKLGLSTNEKEDVDLVQQLLILMGKYDADYTNTFRALTLNEYDDEDLFVTVEFSDWKQQWQERLSRENQTISEAGKRMKAYNPAIIPRNYWVEEVLQEAVEHQNYTPFRTFLDALKQPYAYHSSQEKYSRIPKDDGPYQTYCGT